MQFENDPLHILIMNNNQVVQLADEPADANTLQAGLTGRRGYGPIPDPLLKPAEVRINFGGRVACLVLNIRGEQKGIATLVWESPEPHRLWRRVHANHRMAMSRHEFLQPRMPVTPLPPMPWMTITFGPNFVAGLTPAQRLISVALLWGCSYTIRQNRNNSVRWN